MSSAESTAEDLCAIYVDMGTTNTRVWLMRGSQVLGRCSEFVGVRDTARDRSAARIHTALRGMIKSIQTQTKDHPEACTAECVAAAGMIGSPLGLEEIPHVPAPAGVRELAASSRWLESPNITDLPILLVPGVRSGPAASIIGSFDKTDIMRGEETLCVGLMVRGLLNPPGVVLNLGSHWKAIKVGSDGQIHSSVTSLSGELILATQTQTILASAVSNHRPLIINIGWMEAGMNEQRRSGLARALFCVRLLELANEGTPEDRFSFLAGAFIAPEVDALVARGMFSLNTKVVITGNLPIGEAWRSALAEKSIGSVVLSSVDTQEAFLAGLRQILVISYPNRDLKRRERVENAKL